jgi:hypothetical protein
MSIFMAFFFWFKMKPDPQISYNLNINPIDNMPLVDDDPFAAMAQGGTPIEQRNQEFLKWLSAGLKIRASRTAGSGTIVYYNPDDGWAYVQSCGHLWKGNMTAEEGKRKGYTCKVMTWYHNDQKLSKPKEYRAEVLYYSSIRGRDISLLRFKPDWKPEYFAVAPENFEFKQNMRLHSVGCDSGNEVAHYNVRHVGFRDIGSGWKDLVTTENSPRPGRSGGGLMSDDYFVGICWGTSRYDGNGNGYFTPLSTIREYNKRNGFGWLNEVGVSLARRIPVIDRNNPQGEYSENYIPLPTKP